MNANAVYHITMISGVLLILAAIFIYAMAFAYSVKMKEKADLDVIRGKVYVSLVFTALAMIMFLASCIAKDLIPPEIYYEINKI